MNGTNIGATSEFWWSFPSLMTDQAVITTIPPITCSNPSCLSYFLPGAMTLVSFDDNLPPIGKDNYSDAYVFIVNNAPGYQIEYEDVPPDDLTLSLPDGDCQLYGMPWAAILICIKKIDNALIGGTYNPRQELNVSTELVSIRGCKDFIVFKYYGLVV